MDSLYFKFENAPVTIVATRKIPEIRTPGIVVSETDDGRTLVVPLWVAWELSEAGLAKIADEGVTDEEWTQIHYREKFQPLGQPSLLPDDFYFNAYLTFKRKIEEASGQGRHEDLNRLKGRFRDIMESRVGKIIRLSSAEATVQTRELQKEESTLYKELHELISIWRKDLRKLGDT
jgi:hypothetical protein